jgi:hypothetical protein
MPYCDRKIGRLALSAAQEVPMKSIISFNLKFLIEKGAALLLLATASIPLIVLIMGTGSCRGQFRSKPHRKLTRSQ